MDGQRLAVLMLRVILITTERATMTIMSPWVATVPRMERAMVMMMRDAGCQISAPPLEQSNLMMAEPAALLREA